MQAATISIRAISIDELQAKAGDLMAAHWAEVGKDGVQNLEPDWKRYRLIEDHGGLVALGSFVEDELVGYSVAIRGAHGHDMGEMLLQGDAIFVAKEYRRRGLGLELLRRNEDVARDVGVNEVLWSGPEGGPLARLLKRMSDYRLREVVYAKRVN